MYYINYHTGAGNETAETLEQAMELADANAAYTQEPITIHTEGGEEVARRSWYGTMDGADEEENPIKFGGFGFYADWTDC